MNKATRSPNVGWLLLGDENTGSSRIHGINIHKYLLANGTPSTILQSSTPWTRRLTLSPQEQERALCSDINVLIFQKVFDEAAIAFAERARERGIKTVFLLADRYETPMVEKVDQVVVTSEYLREHLSSTGIAPILIEDAVESPEDLYKVHQDKEPLGLVWVGHSDNWDSVRIVREALDSMQPGAFTLKTISNHPDADASWELATVYDEILTEDVAVIPVVDSEWTLSKSNNRLTMFMALGLPVIASAIPAYVNIVRNGENGFLARDEKEWPEYLELLKSTSCRTAIAGQARRDALKYGICTVGAQWSAVLHRLVS